MATPDLLTLVSEATGGVVARCAHGAALFDVSRDYPSKEALSKTTAAGVPGGWWMVPRGSWMVSVTSWWLPGGCCYFSATCWGYWVVAAQSWWLLDGCCSFLVTFLWLLFILVASGWLLLLRGAWRIIAVTLCCLVDDPWAAVKSSTPWLEPDHLYSCDGRKHVSIRDTTACRNR